LCYYYLTGALDENSATITGRDLYMIKDAL